MTDNSLFLFDESLKTNKGFLLCGVDEAGRGPLAGPVVAAAVILNDGFVLEEINDSKKLSEKKREALFPRIKENSIYGIGIASPEEIDELNILNATFLAMKRAVEELGTAVDLILVDGNRLPPIDGNMQAVVKGDGKSASIAAASILAKVTRDHIMQKLDEEYPQYDFKKHKGYPTKEHYALLQQYGMSPCHRRSFFKKHKI